MADFKYSAGIDVNLNIKSASNQLQELQKQLAQISNMKIDVGTGNLTADIEKASQAAMQLSAHLATATNPKTGNLDFTKFYTSIQKSGASLQEYGEALQKMGPAGQKAFVNLADSISKSEIPLKRTSQMVDKMWDGLKRTAGWQLQSSIIHGVVGSIQSAVGYAKDLNSSLNEIRIVTGQSTEQMAQFAKQANQAAKSLSTTTTDYTKASLIYYQQGLSDEEVKQRTETTIKMANVSGQSAEKVSSQMTAIWNNYDNGSKSLEYYGDVITALGAKTASSSEEIAQGIQKFAAVSDTIGLSYEYAASALATVTATTRESADVVGNAYKTLFSRIQGLNLGETLDDGTTLNKYSTALAKVGISIKDSSGNLKDMDSILNEMGSKWETLSKDQQTALAQTVAGVRQYTQLVALMDNWDTFQQNLQTAKTSSGTLDAQAAIYAESWEAASDRVRASWEGLWDTMINSDSMITILNGISGIVEAMDTLATSMGGAGGVLTSFLGIATKLFAPKLSQGLRDTAYNVSMLFGGEERVTKQRQDFLADARKKINVEGEFGSLYGENESKARIQIMDKQLQMSQLYADKQSQLNPFQEVVNEQYNQAVNAQNERVISAANNLDTQRNALFDATMNTSFIDESLKGIINKQGLDSYLNYTQTELQNRQAQLNEEQTRQRYQDYEQQHPNMTQQNMTEYERLYSEWEQANNFLTQSKLALENDTSTQTAKVALDDFGNALKNVYDIVNSPEAKKSPEYLSNISEALGVLGKTGQQNANTDKYIAAAQQALAQNQDVNFDTLFSNLIQSQGAAIGGTGEIGQSLTEYLSKKFGVLVGEDTLRQEQQRADNLRAGQEANLNETTSTDWASTMVQASEGALTALAAGQSLLALTEQLSNGTANAANSLVSLISTFSQFAMSMASFSSIFKGISSIASSALGATGWGALIAAAISLLPVLFEGIDALIVTEEERKAQEAKTQSELSNAQAQAENNYQSLLKNIDTYEKAQKALDKIAKGTDEWADSLLEANKIATNIITQNGLKEGEDYYRDSNGVLKINQDILDNIEKTSKTSLDTVQAANDLKQLDISTKASIESNKTSLTEEMLLAFNNHPIWELIDKEIEGEALTDEELTYYQSKNLNGVHFTRDDTTGRNEELISFILSSYLKNSSILDSAESIKQALFSSYTIDDITADSIYAIRDSIKAVGNNIQQQYENEARSFLSDETYKNTEQVLAASGRLLMTAYEDVKTNYDTNYKEWAAEYAKDVGIKGYQYLGVDKDKNVKYSYIDEKGNVISDQTLDKGAIQQHQITTTTLSNLNNSAQQLDQIFTNLYKTSDDADGALSSFISEQNMSKASLQTMNSLLNNFNEDQTLEDKKNVITEATGLSFEDIEKISQLEGLDVESWINGLINSLKSGATEIIPELDSLNKRLGSTFGIDSDGNWEWMGQQADFINTLNTNNIKLLNSLLIDMEGTSGQAAMFDYIDSLIELVNTVDGVNKDNLIQMLLNINNAGTASSNLQMIQSIIEGLGGSFQNATSAAQMFANALLNINASGLDDILSKIDQIKNALGDAFNLKTGSNINEDVYENIINAFPELEKLFTKDILNGGYTYTGREETAKETARNAYLATGEDIAQMQDWSKNTAQTWNNTEGKTFTMAEWGDMISNEFARDMIEATQAGSQKEELGIENNSLAMFEKLASGALGQGALEAVFSQQQGIESGNDIRQVLSDYSNGITNMAGLMDTVTTDSNGDGVIDYRDLETATDQQNYLDAQQQATTAQSILSNIWSIIEQLTDTEGLANRAEEFEATKGQTAKDLNQLAEMYNMGEDSDLRAATKAESFGKEGSTIMSNSTDMQNYAENLAFMGSQYEYSAQQAALLSEAIANQDWVTAEALLGQTEMATAIAQTAEARGLDAEALAAQTAQISDALSEAGLSAQSIAETAADMLIAQEGLDDLTASAKDFQSIMRKISSGKLVDTKDIGNLNKMAQAFDKVAGTADLGVKQTNAWNKAFQNFLKKNPKALEEFTKGQGASIKKFQAFQAQMKAQQDTGKDFLSNENDAIDQFGDTMAQYSDEIDNMAVGEQLGEDFGAGAQAAKDLAAGMGRAVADIANAGKGIDAATDLMSDATDFELVPVEATSSAEMEANYQDPYLVSMKQLPDGKWEVITAEKDGAKPSMDANGTYKFYKMVKKGGSGGSGGGGGGGGGGGAKEPKKVANKRKSQTVKRYKRNDAKRESAEKYKKSEENKKDYLYGESKIAQMEKINKLAEKEAKITADRIKESRTYLIEDRENLIKYLQKYGYEAEFDADGFLANYEQVWTDVYEQIAALYEDNLLTEEEEKIEEDLNVMLEELEGALEDYENSLSELQDDIEKYEETLYEMYDNKVEALEHKVEFKIELSEDDLDYLDFWIESLGDNVYNALEAIEAMGAKANALFDGLETYQQGIIDIMSLSDDPLQVWATGGIEGILTQSQIDALRENRDGLADYMQQLIDLRDEIKDKVLDTFDDWQEKLDSTLTTIEHYTSVLEHFKNMIDVVGKDSLGLSNQFMANLEQNAINQSLDSIDANKAYYDNLVEIQQEAQEKLEEARARGDQSSADHWEEVVQSTTEAMQDAQDSLLTSLEDSLNLIAEQFETNMERAVEAFNDAIYAYGGLEGLSNDYSLIRENADLMAADYEKIYELSKITRNINKTLDDTNIIAGKQKLISLQKEINNLQNSGVELSKYDLEYLQAKYELRLAEIELENAQNAKDTVRLSRDSEGNWSYIYTQNTDAVEEAEQKYEDALYEMQKLSQEYLEEMSSSMLDTSSAMMEEISGLRIQDFNSYEEYQAEIKRIQDKYAESLKLQENELNKAVSNSQQIYEQDWRNYNLITGYKISESEKWIDTFRESTIGQLLNSDTIMSSFSDTFLGLTEVLTKNLADSAVSYFTNIDKAFATYGTSIEDFGKHVEESTKKISDKSKEAAGDAKTMATEMNDAFKEIADTVANWQSQFSGEIDKMLEKIKTLIQDINEAIETSANLQPDNRSSSELIGQDEAIDLLNEQGLWGTWGRSNNGALTLNGNATTFTDFNGELIQEIDDKMTEMFNARTGSEERSKLEEEVKELFKQYWLFKDIVGRVYDVTDLQAPTYASMDTGGYTGEWGDSGKFAMLHEKELVLNKDDTKNFLDSLNLSKDIINSMIEMNAKQSSLALGNLVPTSIQDMSQVLEQSVTIQAEFPNATDHSEIEEAFNNLINTASQYANRRK